MARLQAGSVPCGVCSTCGEQHGAGRFWALLKMTGGAEV